MRMHLPEIGWWVRVGPRMWRSTTVLWFPSRVAYKCTCHDDVTKILTPKLQQKQCPIEGTNYWQSNTQQQQTRRLIPCLQAIAHCLHCDIDQHYCLRELPGIKSGSNQVLICRQDSLSYR